MLASSIIFFALAILNIFYGLCKRSGKLLYSFALLIIFIYMTFNCLGPDINEYLTTYNNLINSSGKVIYSGHMESGYLFIMSVCRKIGLDFFSFRIIISIACLLLFTKTIKYYKANGNFVVGLYMMYLFFFDTIQLRNCVVEFLLLFATRYLFQKSFKSTVKYILVVIVASGFHIIALLSLLFLLVKLTRKKSFYQAILMLAAFLLVVCIVLQPILPQLANWMLQFITRGSSYLKINVEIGYLVILILHLMGLIPLYYLKSSITNNRVAAKRVNYILRMNIVLCLLMPLMFINSNFYRIYRNYIVLTYIGLTLIYFNSNIKTSSGGLAAVALILLNIGWFIRDMIIKNDIKVIINPIFEGSLFSDFTQPLMIAEWITVGIVVTLILFTIKLFITERKKKLYAFRAN